MFAMLILVFAVLLILSGYLVITENYWQAAMMTTVAVLFFLDEWRRMRRSK